MSTPQNAAFHRTIGLFDATMLVSGSMIGSGIFIVSAGIAQEVGSSGWLLLIWILTGVITIMGALSYAELAAMMPQAGGQYVYLREAYGPLWGFLYGWTAFTVIQTGFIAAVSVAFAKFLGVLAPALGTNNVLVHVDLGWDRVLPVPWLDPLKWPILFHGDKYEITAGQFVAVCVTVALTAINCIGVQAGKAVQNTFTIAKMTGLAVLILLGLTIALNRATLVKNFTDIWDGIWITPFYGEVFEMVPSPGIAAAMVVGAAMVGSLFSSDSWNCVTFTAGETKDPQRNLPRSLAMGTCIVIGLYLLANVAYLAALPIRSDALEFAERDAELKRQEKEVAGREFDVKSNAANIAMTELDIARDDKRAAELRAKGSTKAAQKLEDENQRRRALIGILKDVGDKRSDELAKARKKITKLQAELAFASGIDKAKDQRVGTAVLERASPNLGVPFMAIAIMISTFGCVNGLVLMGARLYYAMAQDGLFFQSVGRLNQRGVPAAGLVLQALWSIVLIFSGTYGDLLDYIIFAALLFYVLTVAGLFVLRRTRPNAERPYKALGYPVIPALYIALCTFIMLDLLVVKPVYSWPSFLIVLTGIPVYYLWKRKAVAA